MTDLCRSMFVEEEVGGDRAASAIGQCYVSADGSSYVLADNRKLYNIVQDLKGNIRVYCRVRPFLPGETKSSSVVDRIEEGTITIHTPPKLYKEGGKSFTFNKVFGPTVSQVELGDFLTMHPGVNRISFTGGDTGVAISKKAGMIPLQMELGGKDACIILEDADLDLTALYRYWSFFKLPRWNGICELLQLIIQFLQHVLDEDIKVLVIDELFLPESIWSLVICT